jgi:predicted extracellular nuclease
MKQMNNKEISMKKHLPRLFSVFVVLALMLSALPMQSAEAVSTGIVISQVYGGAGCTTLGCSTYKNDYIEIFNRGASNVLLSGLSVQYASAAGSFNAVVAPLSGSLAPGQYYLVAAAFGTNGVNTLPTPDVTGTTAMGATAGKVALVTGTTALGCGATGATPAPCSSTQLAQIIDLVGFGTTATMFEGSSYAPAPSTTTADLRASNGCVETDNNNSDFAAGAPNPRNGASPLNPCGAPGDSAPTVLSTVPAQGASSVPLNSIVTITFSEAVTVTDGWFSLSCATSGAHTATVSGGPTTFTFTPDTVFVNNELCTLTIYAANVTDQDLIDPPDNMASDFTATFTTVTPPISIHDIQGAGHFSSRNGQTVTTLPAIVTALRTSGSTRGFYLQNQEADYDADPATSEGVFVFTGGTSTPGSLVAVGDLVQVSAKVSEYRGATGSLTLTELVAPYTITKLSSSNSLPAPIILGNGGLIPPSTVIEDDASGSVETTGVFDPTNDGIDFYESLEGMLVQVNDAVAVGPRSDFTSNREIPVVGDNGANAVVRTSRGGVIAQANDFNPERIILNDWIAGGPILPAANVGDMFLGSTLGVIDYSFNNFKLQVISMPGLVSGGLTQEVAPTAGLNQISTAAFNVENLAPTDPASKFETLAELVINHMQSPDIMSIEEIQDNTGATNDSVVDAATTWGMLITAIQAAGGPTYEYRQIDPVNNQDGGATGGNIRVGFLFRTDRGLSFIDRPGATSTTVNTVIGSGASTQLQFSPGRIDPTNSAFTDSRKPLAGEFMFNGHHLFVIANHWNSKGGDEPLFGVNQPPTFSSEIQRNQQATVVHNFVSAILTADPNANVLVMGDLNDFQFSSALTTLKGSPAILTDLIETLPLAERYTYVYEGNSETLDHILATNALMARPYIYDVVHVNSEFANQASDHEPQAMVITLNDPPTADAGGPYSVDEGGSVTLTATGSDLEGGTLTYAWDLDNDGMFETPGPSVSFTGVDGPASPTVNIQVTDNGGLTTVASATVTINNIAPTATFSAPAPVDEGSDFSLSLTNPADVPADLTSLQYAFDCGSGYGAFNASNTASCPTFDNGMQNVGGKIMDKDGGVTEYTATVTINNIAPTATFNAPASVNEGSDIVLSLTNPVDVPADLGSLQYAFDCGNGYGAFSASNTASCPTVDNGTQNVGGKVMDKDGGYTEYTTVVTVANVAPVVDISQAAVTNLGILSGNGSFIDPGADTWTATVNYGDNSGVNNLTLNADKTFALSHTYASNGTYVVEVCVSDNAGGTGCDQAQVTVFINRPPVANAGGPYTVIEGSSVRLNASMSIDPENNIVLYEWDLDNDGLFDDATGVKPMFAALDNGVFIVRVRVTDAGGLSSVGSATVTVKNSPPVITSFTITNVARVGANVNARVIFKDAGVNDTFTAVWNWGDGSTSNGSISNHVVSGSHTYSKPGIYLVTITITDKDGGVARAYNIVIVSKR